MVNTGGEWKGSSRVHADNWDTVKAYEPGDCYGNGAAVPFKGQNCAYIGNMGGLKVNYP